MGLIKAITGAIGGGFADQWLEVIEADRMTDQTVMTMGVKVRPDDSRNSNTKGTVDTVSNGSIIHVYPNQFMMLVENGRIIDYTAEEGTFQVDNSSLPSMFNGQFGDSLGETFSRFKYGGVTPSTQKVIYINLQEIKNIKFGTKNPIQYFDNFYNAELFLRCFGNYSIKITDPILFYQQVVDKSARRQEIEEINEQYLSEFLNALGASMNQMSADGIRISHVTSKSMDLANYMSNTLDQAWEQNRGFQVMAVGIASLTYDDESKELINMRNKGAMLGDPMVREGYVQGSIARGLENAGSNPNGAAATFMGMGMGMQTGGNYMGTASQNNTQQWQQQQAAQQQINPQMQNGSPMPNQANTQTFNGVQESGQGNTAGGAVMKFCPNCGTSLPQDQTPNFCPSCGHKLK